MRAANRQSLPSSDMPGLSPGERHVVILAASHSNPEIALLRGVSISTVKAVLSQVRTKVIDMENRALLANTKFSPDVRHRSKFG